MLSLASPQLQLPSPPNFSYLSLQRTFVQETGLAVFLFLLWLVRVLEPAGSEVTDVRGEMPVQ